MDPQELKPDPPLLFGQLSLKVALPDVTDGLELVTRMEKVCEWVPLVVRGLNDELLAVYPEVIVVADKVTGLLLEPKLSYVIVNLTTVVPLAGTVIVPVGDTVQVITVFANAGVADAPKATIVESSPRIMADFLFNRLMNARGNLWIYSA